MLSFIKTFLSWKKNNFVTQSFIINSVVCYVCRLSESNEDITLSSQWKLNAHGNELFDKELFSIIFLLVSIRINFNLGWKANAQRMLQNSMKVKIASISCFNGNWILCDIVENRLRPKSSVKNQFIASHLTHALSPTVKLEGLTMTISWVSHETAH